MKAAFDAPNYLCISAANYRLMVSNSGCRFMGNLHGIKTSSRTQNPTEKFIAFESREDIPDWQRN